MREHYSEYFYGNKISNYGLEHGRIDYATLAKAFDTVLNNEIMGKTYDIGYWEQTSGIIDNSDEIEELEEKIGELTDKIDELNDEIDELETDDKYEESEELKEKIVSLEGKIAKFEEEKEELEEEQDYPREIFQYYIVSDNGASILEDIDEIVFYNEELDMYIWGVTHYGTSWDYVLTDIKIVKDTEN